LVYILSIGLASTGIIFLIRLHVRKWIMLEKYLFRSYVKDF